MTGDVTGSILVVDDSRSARLMALRTITNLGWTVRVAADGFDAIKQLKSFDDIFLVVTDLVMPQMSGLSLIQYVNATTHPKHSINTVVLTVDRTPVILERMKSLGVLGVLTKPIQAKAFEVLARQAQQLRTESLLDQDRSLQ